MEGVRAFLYFDQAAARRGIDGRVDKATAFARAQCYLNAK